MGVRNIITAYMDRNHRVIRKIRGVRPNQAVERAVGYLATQHFRDSETKRYAVYAEVYEEDTTLQHAGLKYNAGSGKIEVVYKRDPQGFENRYAASPLFEGAQE